MIRTSTELAEAGQRLKQQGIINDVKDAVAYAQVCYELSEFQNRLLFGSNVYFHLKDILHDHIAHGTLSLLIDPNYGGHRYTDGPFDYRFHRVDPGTLVPLKGDTAKEESRKVASLGPSLFPDEVKRVGRNLVAGIVATPEMGLLRVTLGELVNVIDTGNYGYEVKPIDLFCAPDGPSGDGVRANPEFTPPPIVTLGKQSESKTGTRDD